MSINYLAGVLKLLRRENYEEWAFVIENVFILNGLSKCLVENGEKDTNKLNKARAKLVLSIDPTLYVHVREASSVVELWKKLKNLYAEKSF